MKRLEEALKLAKELGGSDASLQEIVEKKSELKKLAKVGKLFEAMDEEDKARYRAEMTAFFEKKKMKA